MDLKTANKLQQTILQYIGPCLVDSSAPTLDKEQEEGIERMLEDPDSPLAHYLMRKWRMVWMCTVAEAWNDAAFKKLLCTDAHTAIQDLCRNKLGLPKFTLPGTLKLRIRDVEAELRDKAKEEGVDYKYDWEMGWPDLPPNELVMPLPPMPTNVDDAVALANYANAGRTYPFTCCW